MTGAEVPERLRAFVERVRARDFWESHEILEGPWRRCGSDFLQGLILYASAFVHLERGNAHGVRAQATKALEALDGYPDAYLGFDVAAIREHARRCRDRIGGEGASAPPGWAEAMERPALEVKAARIRGDEPELDAL